MGQAVDETKRQLELTRQAIAGHLDQMERKLRAELDWRARLRRDGPQIAVVLATVGGLTALAIVARRRAGARRAAEERAELEALRRASLRDLALELHELRAEVEKLRNGKGGKDGAPLWARLALGVAGTAASAGGRVAARRMMEQQPTAEHHGAEAR